MLSSEVNLPGRPQSNLEPAAAVPEVNAANVPKPARFFVFGSRNDVDVDTSQAKNSWILPRDTNTYVIHELGGTLLATTDVFILFCQSTTGELYGSARVTGFCGPGRSTANESTAHRSRYNHCFSASNAVFNARALTAPVSIGTNIQPSSAGVSHAPELRMDARPSPVALESYQPSSFLNASFGAQPYVSEDCVGPLRRAHSPTDRIEEPLWTTTSRSTTVSLEFEWVTKQQMPFHETHRLCSPRAQTLLWLCLQQSEHGTELGAAIGAALLDIWHQYIEETSKAAPDQFLSGNTWAMRVLHIPVDATLTELQRLFMPPSFPGASGIGNLNAISISFLPAAAPIYWNTGSALVHYSSQFAMQTACEQFNGSRLRPGDSFCPLLSCLPDHPVV
ncbi:hypothetical protein MIND_01376100 [Mycena indigotica]|uniref:YTH domain-containing protein n=1 Tax=Mycena indigotica TaxID=2126181 RepID=A0A8H6RZB8_9AGAR|nr:uncharacterized protein MIND_01376100 [Mycena indigotica]KAF7289151.1 hypothetical protein MIND_01376100 [Mycena indigotica]